MRAHLIANPSSGSDRALPLLPVIASRLRSMVSDLEITVTEGADDVVRAAARAARDGTDLLFVGGGDGTLNAAVGAVARVPGGLGRLAFGIIPLGTGNDFAKAVGVGEDPEAALDVLLHANVIDVDLGTLDGRPFFNVSAGGFVADVSATLTEELKDATGKLAFVIGGARALLGREPFTTAFCVRGQTPVPPLDLQMFAVCNARLIGGGYPIAPDALIDDGVLDVFMVKRTPTLEFVALLQKIAAGGHTDDERILHFRTRELDLTFDREVHVNVDGEVLEARQCTYHVLHRAARFLCGTNPHAAQRPRRLVV